jgi:hypothetical protein
MNIRQSKALADIEHKLMDVFLDEADPDTWPTINKKDTIKEQQAARGNRYWSAKNANQTMALLTRITAYRQKLKEGITIAASEDSDKGLERDMRTAEKKVTARLSLVKKRAA